MIYCCFDSIVDNNENRLYLIENSYIYYDPIPMEKGLKKKKDGKNLERIGMISLKLNLKNWAVMIIPMKTSWILKEKFWATFNSNWNFYTVVEMNILIK